jgi:capsid protein
MSSVNYSSARVGLGEERDVWRDLQSVVTHFCRDVYHRWLRSAMVSQKLEITAKDYEQLQNPNWKPRGWRYVDPQKEITASIDAISNNLATYRQTLGEQGFDLEEFLAEKQAEMALFAQYGIPYEMPKAATGQPAAGANPDNTGDGSGDTQPQDNAAREFDSGTYAN